MVCSLGYSDFKCYWYNTPFAYNSLNTDSSKKNQPKIPKEIRGWSFMGNEYNR